jgi:hypothetical protein
MHKHGSLFASLLVFLMLALGIASSANHLPSAHTNTAWLSGVQSGMFQDLQTLTQLFSIDHTIHWKHSVPHFGDVTTAMSVIPTNFDGCAVVWSETQEGTRPGQLFYIETHRFEVPLTTMDAQKITVQAVASGQSQRPGIEPGDYYTVLLPSLGGKNTVNMVDHDIVFDPHKGPIASVHQLLVSSAWVRVRQEENGESIKSQFQKTIASCKAAGQ